MNGKLKKWRILKLEIVELEDKYKEEVAMVESDAEKYLGDILSTNGSNTKNIEARTSKGHGIVNQIM